MALNTLGPSVHIVGEFRSDEDLHIEGRVEGTIHIGDALLTIGSPATVQADIRGSTINIRATVRGTISAAERIEIAASASVNGYLTANHVIIAEGATFNGRIDMGRRGIAAVVARYTGLNTAHTTLGSHPVARHRQVEAVASRVSRLPKPSKRRTPWRRNGHHR